MRRARAGGRTSLGPRGRGAAPRALAGGGGGHHPHHHHGGGGRGWGPPGWYGYNPYPSPEVFVVDAPMAPLYASCPCPCRCHDGATYHTVPVAQGQACCRCPFLNRTLARRAGVPMSGLGSLMSELGADFGANSPTSAQIRALQRQVNRFAVGSAPTGYQFLTQPVAITGVLDYATALAAAQLLRARAGDAYETFGPSERAGGVYARLLQNASMAVLNPQASIGADVPGATAVITMFGNIHGIPPASSAVTEAVSKAVSDPRVVAAGAAAALLWFMTRRR